MEIHMKTMLVALGTLLATSMSYGADPTAQQELLNAITVCPTQANPLTALADMHGNSLGDAQFENHSSTAILVDVVYNPQLYNTRIMTPIRLLGKIRVEMTYPEPGYALVCKIAKLKPTDDSL
jgi:hypothetical protein